MTKTPRKELGSVNLTHKFTRLRAGLGGPFFQFKDPRARRPLLGGALFQFKPEAGRVAVLVLFGDAFDQSLDGVTLPSGLQTLTFGMWFNKSLKQVMLPSGLQRLTFGAAFDQRLGGVR